MSHPFTDLFGQLLLPLFVMMLLFGIAGVSPDAVLRAAGTIAVSLIEGIAKIIITLVQTLLRPKNTGHRDGGTDKKD